MGLGGVTTETVYNGSLTCPQCGRLITPLEALYSDLCPDCEALRVRALIQNGMVPNGFVQETPTGGKP